MADHRLVITLLAVAFLLLVAGDLVRKRRARAAREGLADSSGSRTGTPGNP